MRVPELGITATQDESITQEIPIPIQTSESAVSALFLATSYVTVQFS